MSRARKSLQSFGSAANPATTHASVPCLQAHLAERGPGREHSSSNPIQSETHVREARHREAASDFNAALAEYRQYLQRAAEAAEMRAAAEAAGPSTGGPEGGAPSDQGDLRLKPGETLRLPAVKVHGALSKLPSVV